MKPSRCRSRARIQFPVSWLRLCFIIPKPGRPSIKKACRRRTTCCHRRCCGGRRVGHGGGFVRTSRVGGMGLRAQQLHASLSRRSISSRALPHWWPSPPVRHRRPCRHLTPSGALYASSSSATGDTFCVTSRMRERSGRHFARCDDDARPSWSVHILTANDIGMRMRPCDAG